MQRLLPILLALLIGACANIRFERGPYAIRGLEVVYSDQEGLTFLSWRVRKDAKLSLVEFELWLDGEYQTLDLADAPFPAEPQDCGDTWCFQYQVEGEYEGPDLSPMRSVHRDDGVFMGPAERQRRVLTTFATDPIALGKNDAIDPRRFDWFAENAVPLERPYEWQFTTWKDGACDDPTAGWRTSSNPIDVDRSWVEDGADGVCFHLRPTRQDKPSVWHTDVLVPSAETAFEAQRYAPARIDAPIVWGMLLDLEVPDATRCTRVKGRVIDMVEGAIAARGDDIKLGIYTPVDSETGDELTGCDQASSRDYPLEKMLADAQAARAELEPEQTRVLWIFVNNIELPPSERILEQLQLFGLALVLGGEFDPDDPPEGVEDIPVGGLGDVGVGALGTEGYAWAIGSNVFMGLLPWDITTPWRPVEDETFLADIRSVAKNTLPFSTQQHETNTEVAITAPRDADSRPLHFKLCDASPFPLTSIGVIGGRPQYDPLATVPWPEFDDDPPYYTVELPPQVLVENARFARRTEQVIVEVCTAFCDGPFRNRGGEDFPAWRGRSICQWSL